MKIKLYHIALAWLVFAVVMAVIMYIVHPPSQREYSFISELKWEVAFSLVWIAATQFVFGISRRYSLRSGHKVRNGAIIIFSGMLISIVLCFSHALIVFALYPEITHFTINVLMQSFFYNIDKMIIVYCVLILLQQVMMYYREVQEKEIRESQLHTQLAQAQMQALKMQLQPHFLFNTLNAIITLIHKNPELAEEMIVRLSDFLRLTLDASGKQLVSLKEELTFVKAYLDIEKLRFEDKFQYQEHVSGELFDAEVPLLLLQPLVENAMKHGISRYATANMLEISAQRNNGNLVVIVKDNGAPVNMENGWHQTEGIGLTNTRNRLEALYGSKSSLTISPNLPSGFAVTITLPLTLVEYENERTNS